MIAHSKPTITEDDNIAVLNCLKSNLIANGNLVEKFREKLSDYLSIPFTKITDSGTSALILALKIISDSEKKEVLLPSYVCKSVLQAILLNNLVPVFYDHNSKWKADYESIEEKINKNTLALIVVHTMGIANAELNRFVNRDFFLIEDCCQSFGLKISDKYAGSFGDMSIFSFNATKCITTGDGGGLVVNNELLKSKAEKVIASLDNSFVMADINASLGISQLNQYNTFLKRRLEIATYYINNISQFLTEDYRLIFDDSIHYRFLIKIPKERKFEEVKEDFYNLNISIRKGVDMLLCENDNIINAKELLNQTISIPIYPSLLDREVDKIVQACNKILN